MPVADPNPISLDECYKKSESIVSRRIAGEAVLVPLRRNAADLDAIYALNETAAAAWDALDGAIALRQVLQRVLAEFEVDDGTAEKDLLELMTQLRDLGAVEKV
jgi:hypothetical protein